jgi:SSS family solute:Na+ symporter
VLSVVSLITFVLSKIAVGIFAGGVVFGTLLPELHLNIGGVDINSFWIGTMLVIVLTGLYTMLGGMRAVAYNDAVQTFILILGSGLLTTYGLHELGGWDKLREVCGAEMFNLWKPLTPPGVETTWAPMIVKNDAGQLVKQAWYFNSNYPWLGMLFCAPIIGLWLGTGPVIVQRALGAPNEQTARRGSIFAAFLKLLPVFLFIIPGLICFALAKSGKIPELGSLIGPDGKAIPARAQGAFPMMVQHLLPPGLRGIVVGTAFRADGLAGRRLQRLLHAVYRGSVPEMEAWSHATRAGTNGPDRHGSYGPNQSGMDSSDPRGTRTL